MTKKNCVTLITCVLLCCESNPPGLTSFPSAKLNPEDCTNDPGICQNGLHCDFDKHDCVPGPECTVATQDVDCKPFPTRPYCVDIQGNHCRECRPLSKSDCSGNLEKPFCGVDAICHACTADNECSSGICRKAGDYPNPGAMMGQCVSIDEIAYVNQDSVNCINSGTASSQNIPFCTLNAAMNANKNYIYVAASQTAYPAISLNTSGRTVIIVGDGDGRNNAPATIFNSSSPQSAVSVQNGTLVISSARIIANSSNGAVSCSGTGSSLYIIGAYVQNSGGRGIDASCKQITVDRTIVDCDKLGVQRYGISIGSGQNTDYWIVNSAVINCGNFSGSGERHGVYLGPQAIGYFAFNTVTANYRGVLCVGGQNIINSIVAGNSNPQDPQVESCGFDQSYVVTDINKVEFLAPGNPRLKKEPSMINDTYIFDKALLPSGSQAIMNDYDGTLRPKGKGYDIGFQELK